MNWLSLYVKITLCHNRTKYILMAIQWQIFITMYAITLSKTAGQSLWRNNKKYQILQTSLGLKSLPEKEFINLPMSGSNSRHTSQTLSKHSPQHQSGPLLCLGGNLSGQNPTLDFKRVVFLMIWLMLTWLLLGLFWKSKQPYWPDDGILSAPQMNNQCVWLKISH